MGINSVIKHALARLEVDGASCAILHCDGAREGAEVEGITNLSACPGHLLSIATSPSRQWQGGWPLILCPLKPG